MENGGTDRWEVAKPHLLRLSRAARQLALRGYLIFPWVLALACASQARQCQAITLWWQSGEPLPISGRALYGGNEDMHSYRQVSRHYRVDRQVSRC